MISASSALIQRQLSCVMFLAFTLICTFAQPAFAKEKECCWIDTKTGKQANTVPAGITDGHEQLDAVKSGRAYNSRLGKNYVREPDGCWINTKTGEHANTVPAGITDGHEQLDAVKSGRAYNSRLGKNYVRVPCPAPGQATGDTLKKVFESVHIGIGIGGGYTSGHDEHHHGEDRHRTTEKVSTDKTKTHKTSPTTTHKTVTSACKCHPCTCSPCTCH
jgi:hypothetical protein